MSEFLTLPIDQLSDPQVAALRDQALNQHQWARQYAMQLISSVPNDLWYKIPEGMSTHLAWQVGHLAVSQYGLMLFRQRGRAEGDVELMPGWLRKQFGRGTKPMIQNESTPKPEDLLARLNQIHQQSIVEVSQLSTVTMREACDMPFCVYPNKLGALMFAPIHEGIHSGQIGLIRRGLGLDPIR
ncbi:MAG: DinB family protein [Pirellulales bacterium]